MPAVRNNRLRRLGPPAVLLGLLTWLMVGCIYVPWFEQRSDQRSIDFRPLVGGADSDKPIRVGRVTREQVSRLLGVPEYDNQHVAVYKINSFVGYWIYPECFAVDQGLKKCTVVRFEFDDDGVLRRYDLSSDSDLFRFIDYAGSRQVKAIDKLNERGLSTPGGN